MDTCPTAVEHCPQCPLGTDSSDDMQEFLAELNWHKDNPITFTPRPLLCHCVT